MSNVCDEPEVEWELNVIDEEIDDVDWSIAPAEMSELGKVGLLDSLPEKSKVLYEKKYEQFMSWCSEKDIHKISENILLDYFSELAKVKKSPTLWSTYSMLKSTLQIKNNICIKGYRKLKAFLKREAAGYKSTFKSKTLSRDEITQFLLNAPDKEYLMKKVVLIFGIAGGCQRDELAKMSIDDVQDKESVIIVNVSDSISNKSRYFIISNNNEDGVDYLTLCRTYFKRRPQSGYTKRLFLKYNKGVCTNQVFGKNSIAKIPKQIAEFLDLPQPNMYTSHCFRKTSNLLMHKGGDRTRLKSHEGWRKPTVAETDIELSVLDNPDTTYRSLGATSEDISNRTRANALYSRNLGSQRALKDGNSPSTSSRAILPHSLQGMGFQDGGQFSGAGPEVQTRFGESMIPKFKQEELDLEDYQVTETSMRNQTLEESNADFEAGVTTEMAHPSEAKVGVLESPFETVFCEGSMKIKEEIEDETDTLGVSDINNISDVYPSSEELTNAGEPPCKKPRAAILRCYICQYEASFDESDLVNHYNSKHSGVTILSPMCGLEEDSLSTQSKATVDSKQPPKNPPGGSDKEDDDSHPDGVFISLKDVPVERREATKERIKSLVDLIVNLNLNPVRVKLVVSVLPKFPALTSKQQPQPAKEPVVKNLPLMQYHPPPQDEPVPQLHPTPLPHQQPSQMQPPSLHHRSDLNHQPTPQLEPNPQLRPTPRHRLPPQLQVASEYQPPVQHQPVLHCYQPDSQHRPLSQHFPASQYQPPQQHLPAYQNEPLRQTPSGKFPFLNSPGINEFHPKLDPH